MQFDGLLTRYGRPSGKPLVKEREVHASHRSNPLPFSCEIVEGARKSRSEWRRIWHASCFSLCLWIAVAGAGVSAGTEGTQRKETSVWMPDPPVQQRPIVNGRHVQPRPSDFIHPEFTPEQSREVDDLYLQIMRMHDSEAREASRVLKEGHD
jgi:hypothetical protein